MKKKFIAKLLVLGLVLAMLPTAAFALEGTKVPVGAQVTGYDAANNVYYYVMPDTNVVIDKAPADSSDSDASATALLTKPAEPTTVITEIVVEGDKAVLEVEVVDGVAYVVVTEDALSNVVVEGDTLTLVVKAEGANKVFVDLPAAALVKLGKNVVVECAGLATVTIPADVSGIADAKTVTIAVAVSDDDARIIAVTADDAPLKGIEVEL